MISYFLHILIFFYADLDLKLEILFVVDTRTASARIGATSITIFDHFPAGIDMEFVTIIFSRDESCRVWITSAPWLKIGIPTAIKR
eukprot:19596_1